MSKWERFLVVSGTASIKLRKVGEDAEGRPYPVDEYVVSGSDMRAVEMIPGYTHSITNLSDTEDLVTVMWANEPFRPREPRYLLRGGLAACARTVPKLHSRTTAA